MLLAVLERPDVYVFSFSVHRSGPGPLLLIPIIGPLIDQLLTPKGLSDETYGESGPNLFQEFNEECQMRWLRAEAVVCHYLW
jgi:hypothetical protein